MITLRDALPLTMFITLGVLIFSGLPVAVVLTGIGLGFGLIGYALGFVRLTDFGAIYYRVFGTLSDSEDILWSAVPLLIFMGAVLQQSGIARDLLRSLQVLLQWLPGRLAVVVMVIGVVLAPATGLIGASVGTLALMVLPTMLAQGYKPSFAAGSIAAAGTLGVIAPPAIMLFFLADAMGMQVPFIFLAMVGPTVMLLGLYLAYVVAAAWLTPDLAPSPAADDGRAERGLPIALARGLVAPVLLVTVILGSVIAGWASPSESAALGALGALLLGLSRGQFGVRQLHEVIRRTTITTAMVFFIFVGASIFSLIFRLLGGVEAVAGVLIRPQLGHWGTLAVVLSVIFLLGCFLDWIEIVVISFVVFRPVLDGLDFTAYVGHPYLAFGWITVLIALTLHTSFLTPPFGFGLFFLRGSAPAGLRMADVYRGIVPFVLLQLLVIGGVASFPAIATWLPDHVLDLKAPRTIKGTVD